MAPPPGAKINVITSVGDISSYDSVIIVGNDGSVRGSIAELKSLLGDRCSGALDAFNGSNKKKLTFGTVSVHGTAEQSSRHNHPARPDAMGDAVFSAAGECSKDSSLFIIVCVSSEKHILPAVSAVAKVFPEFTMKTALASGDDSNNKVVRADENPLQVSILATVNGTPAGDSVVAPLQGCIDSVRLAAALVDSPANIMHTDRMVEEARKVSDEVNASMTVIRGEDLEKEGLGLLFGVGKASVHPPSLVILRHGPATQSAGNPVVAFVGKGIVYDTGGLSIKGKDFMPGMKRDMGGSAAVLGAFAACAKTNSQGDSTLYALLCLAENSVADCATRPDDIHTGHSGLTVEINNTDAEGRLALADGCSYASRILNATHIIDIATLTGAQGIATGQRHAAVMSNDADMESIAMKAGISTGDLTFPVPYCPEFFCPEFKSEVATMKNSVKARNNAQVSCAGQFIANHIEPFIEGGKWLHVDCASPSFFKARERGTGYGVLLLRDLFLRITAGEV